MRKSRQRGQALTEYISFIAILAVVFTTVAPVFRNAMRSLFERRVGQYLEKRFFQSGAIYRFPLKIPD